MDATAFDLVLFVSSTFLAALVAGLAGFAFGLVAAAVWLHVLTPDADRRVLIIAFGLIVQGIAVWKLRHALQWARLWPFLLGGALGVPIGVTALAWVTPETMRLAIGAVLIAYSGFALVRPVIEPVKRGGAGADAGGRRAEWSSRRRDRACRDHRDDVVRRSRLAQGSRQRTVFQPVGVAVFIMSAAWLGTRSQIDRETIRLFALGLPALAAGTWLGLKLYGALDETAFRRVVLLLLLGSGLALVIARR